MYHNVLASHTVVEQRCHSMRIRCEWCLLPSAIFATSGAKPHLPLRLNT